jgi:hypothetical protein
MSMITLGCGPFPSMMRRHGIRRVVWHLVHEAKGVVLKLSHVSIVVVGKYSRKRRSTTFMEGSMGATNVDLVKPTFIRCLQSLVEMRRTLISYTSNPRMASTRTAQTQPLPLS